MSDKYWVAREQESLLNAATGRAEKELAQQYIRCLNRTKKDLIALYSEIQAASADGSLLISDLYKFNRYYDLMNNLNSELNKLGLAEKDIFEKYMTDLYAANNALLSSSFGFQPIVDSQRVKDALNKVWCRDGKHWSDRIWANKALLQERVKDGVIDSIASGCGKDELVKQLMKDFNVGYNNADRIARTELSYVRNQSTYDSYKEAGIEYYQFLATDDDKTGEEDRELDGKIFRLDEAVIGVNYPPIHPNCRCSVLAVIKGKDA